MVEVASTSQTVDRAKAGVYAAANVPVYWLVDLAARELVEHASPSPEGYAERRVLGLGAVVEVPGLGVRWDVDSLF